MIPQNREDFSFKLPGCRLPGLFVCMAAAALLGLGAGRVWSAETGSPVVRAVLFSSPTCAHCAKVREEVLPPLAARYGAQLQVVIVSTATRSGYELFLSASLQHGLSLSVPLLIVGSTALVGSDEIPMKFPDIIDKHIAAGGIDWPDIPGLRIMLAANPAFASDPPPRSEPVTEESAAAPPASASINAGPAAEPRFVPPVQDTPQATVAAALPAASPPDPQAASNTASPGPATPASPKSDPATPSDAPPADRSAAEPSGIIDLTGGEAQAGIMDRIRRDLYGNGLAILTLAGMLVALLFSPMTLTSSRDLAGAGKTPERDWLTPVLALAGMGIAAYLSHVELREVEAICGPVGDCNTVQQSEYARLFGILPIGVIGFAGFLAILAVWALRRWGSDRISLWASLGILGMTGFGTLFSVYLTFLEPFVIGATCLWCLSSAVIMTMLYTLALKPGRRAWSGLAAADRTRPADSLRSRRGTSGSRVKKGESIWQK